MILRATAIAASFLLTLCALPALAPAADGGQSKAADIVAAAVRPVMEKHQIPGMAIGVIDGDKSYIFNYGIASKQTQKPVTDHTLFEIGSISKTFTVTLAAYAAEEGRLSLADKTSKYLPALQDSAFGDVSLLHLATHTPGGFPLQLPGNVKTNRQLTAYLKEWKPAYPAGTTRTYANPSIGMLGVITARAMKQDFATLMENCLFRPLGLASTFVNLPDARRADYAQGYSRMDNPARMSAVLLSAEAYGVRTTAADLTRFVAANMGLIALDQRLQQAITATHTGYFRVGAMTQDLIWEQYAYPADLQTLLQGNSPDIVLKPVPVTPITPPGAPRADVLINKTGSTNGFGSYVAFVPAKKLGIVILANKNYPSEDRIRIAYQILTRLDPAEQARQ